MQPLRQSDLNHLGALERDKAEPPVTSSTITHSCMKFATARSPVALGVWVDSVLGIPLYLNARDLSELHKMSPQLRCRREIDVDTRSRSHGKRFLKQTPAANSYEKANLHQSANSPPQQIFFYRKKEMSTAR